MIALTALALLAAVALLLLYPGGTAAGTLRGVAAEHPRLIIGVSCMMGVVIAIGGLWPSPRDRECGPEGYGELWHMIEQSPAMREPARADLADGRITCEELQKLREIYRRAPDLDTMRSGVVKELSR